MYSKILILICLVILLTADCSKNSTEPEMIGVPGQFIVISIQPVNLPNAENGEIIIQSALKIDGRAVADTLPSIESVTVNGIPFAVESGFEFGEKTFTIIYNNDVSSIENIDIEVRTSAGTLSGSVASPDTISNISFNPTLPIQSNQKLTIIWDKGNAQYYRYSLYSRRNYFEEITTANKIEIPATQFRSDGTYQLAICGVNGPVPQEGAKGNMSGDGVGFLYFINSYQYFDITVGDE
jgi:hypothetical protein